MDLTFKADHGKFNLRVGALIRSGGKVLMATSPLEGENVYYSVGGRVKYGETFEEAIRREVMEETGLAFDTAHMVAVHENFFVNVEGYPFHEISVYFIIDDKRFCDIPDGHPTEEGPDGERLYWVDPDDESLTLFPQFCRDKSFWEGTGIKHYVVHEDSWYSSLDNKQQK